MNSKYNIFFNIHTTTYYFLKIFRQRHFELIKVNLLSLRSGL